MLVRLAAAMGVITCATSLYAERVEILRDNFGVPHIFASTAAGACFGEGYAQAEDRLEELLKNYLKAEGGMTDVFGADWIQQDYLPHLLENGAVSRENYHLLPAEVRHELEAYLAGIQLYMTRHPDQVPAWAPKLEPWMEVALARYMVIGWSAADMIGDLKRAHIDFDPPAYHGSNEVLIAPARTRDHAAIAIIDPQMYWYGEYRFYEVRLYGGPLAASGATILGLPYPILGHTAYASIAITSGGPDTADIFEEEISNGRYKYKNQWLPLRTWQDRIGGRAVEFQATRHGPVIAHKEGKAYVAATAYAGQYRALEQVWRMLLAHNLSDMKKAMTLQQLMPANIMIGTVDGDIYYVRNGRVPIRPPGCDSTLPMQGEEGACDWLGTHPFTDLVQIQNPPQNYMQNCNVAPQWMMKDSALTPAEYAEHPYLYNAAPDPPNQRAAMVLATLQNMDHVSIEDAMRLALSPEVYKAAAWQDRIRKAGLVDGSFVNLILGWDGKAEAQSQGALAFYLFKEALGKAGGEVTPPPDLSDNQVRDALQAAAKRWKESFPPDATWGTYFRVGRDGSPKTYPVSGGTLYDVAMETPRTLLFEKTNQLFIAHGGQSATQVVELTRPPKSYMVMPLGESDHPDSPHFDDQTEQLFSRSKMQPTYFMDRAGLEKVVSQRTELSFH